MKSNGWYFVKLNNNFQYDRCYARVVKDGNQKAHFHNCGKCYHLLEEYGNYGIFYRLSSTSKIGGVACSKMHN